MCACVWVGDRHLFVVLHDREDGVNGAEDAQGHDSLVLVFLVLLTLEDPGEDLSLPNKKQKKQTHVLQCILTGYLCIYYNITFKKAGICEQGQKTYDDEDSGLIKKKGDFETQTPKQTLPLFQWLWKTVETVFVADRGFDLHQGFNGILFILFYFS